MYALLLSCTNPLPAPADAPGAALARGLPLGEMTLQVIDPVAASRPVGLKVVGALPNHLVSVLAGAPGRSCPAGLYGACVDLNAPHLLASATTDAAGAASLPVSGLPAGLLGADLVLQAVVVDGTAAYVSNPVERTVMPPSAFAPPPGGNILILLADDVGVDQIGSYGVQSPSRTPTVDALAASGMRFAHAWALPLCGPTRAAIQTGRYPRRTGMGDNIVFRGVHELDPEQISLAEIVEYSPWFSYSSSYVGKWHLSTYLSATGPLAAKVQGWEYFAGHLANLNGWIPPMPVAPPGYYNWQKFDDLGGMTVSSTYVTTDSVDEAIGRVLSMPEPWILQLSFAAGHGPLDLPPPGLHTDAALTAASPDFRKADAILEAMDTEIGRLLRAFPQAKLARTNLFFLGDNGTDHAAMDPGVDHERDKGTLYDGGVRVPFIVSGPIVGQPGAVSESLVSVVDLLPTVAALVGTDTGELLSVLDRTEALELDGRSLLPVLADPTVPVHEVLFAELFRDPGAPPYLLTDLQAVRDAQYKLVVNALDGREYFFEYLPGAVDEGVDLLPCGLTPPQQAGLLRLRDALRALVQGQTFDNAPWPLPVADTADTGETGDTALPSDTSDTGAGPPACALLPGGSGATGSTGGTGSAGGSGGVGGTGSAGGTGSP